MQLIGIHTQEVAERIVNVFRHPDQLPAALAPIFIHRKDGVPCRKWSWSNQLIAALCGTTDARGFRQWEETGRKIKKGSKAIWILAPCVKNIKEENDKGEDVERRVLYGFKAIPVFAVEDTEGESLPTTDDRYDSWQQELPLLEVAKAWDITVGTYSGNENTPLGYFQYGLGRQAVMLGVENLSTWAHEMVHAADHRLPGGDRSDRAHKEIVAELGGAVLLECLGMSQDADLGGAYQYIQRYADEAKKDVIRVCIELLDRVCNCVKLILEIAEKFQEEAALVAA
jgi:antirestriction protein ArdC